MCASADHPFLYASPRHSRHLKAPPMPRPRLLAGLVLALVTLFVVASSRATAAPAAAGAASQFGIDWISSAEQPPSAERVQLGVATGAGWDRWVFYWSNIERSPGQFDWSRQDAAFLAEANAGLSINAILLTTPDAYARAGKLGQPVPDVRNKRPLFELKAAYDKGELPAEKVQCSGAANTYPPRSLNEPLFISQGGQTMVNPANHWARFVYSAVQRYKPGGELAQAHGLGSQAGVRAWEIWNEPDWDCGHAGGGFGGFFNGTPAEYYQMLKAAYLIIKFADPSATVVTGGLTFWANPGWFDTFAAAAQADPDKAAQAANGFYFDAFALHWYSNVRHALEMSYAFSTNLQAAGFGRKPIWLTETGLPLNGDAVGPPADAAYTGTPDDQASYIIQNAAYALRVRADAPSGVDKVFHFQLYDDGIDGALGVFGLLRNPTGSPQPHPTQPGAPRPGYAALQVVAKYLEGATPIDRAADDKTERLVFRRPDGGRVTVVWNWTANDRVVSIPATATSAVRVDRLGGETIVHANRGAYSLTLPGATNFNQVGDPRPMLGGAPYLIVESGSPVPTATATPSVAPPTATPTASPPPTPGPTATPQPDGCVNLTANPGFESEAHWVFEQAITSPFQAYQGARSAVVGLISVPQYQVWSTVRQTVRLPASAGRLSLRYARALSGGDGAHRQVVEIWVGDDILTTLEEFSPAVTQPWTVQSFDLTDMLRPYMGQDIRLSFATRNDPGAARASYLRLDEVTLTACAARPLAGRVLDMAGWPIADATVSVAAPDFNATLTTDASGNFALDDTPLAGLTIGATAPGYGAWAARPVAETDTNIELRLPPVPNAVRNGGFDPLAIAVADWTLSGDTPVVAMPQGLSGAGILLGRDYAPMPGNGSNSTLSQTVTLPDVDGVGLTFAYRMTTDETAPGQDFFEALVFDRGTRTDLIERLWHPSAGWGYRWLDLGAWRGKTVTLVFNVYQASAERPTLVALDEVSVGAGRFVARPHRLFLPQLNQ